MYSTALLVRWMNERGKLSSFSTNCHTQMFSYSTTNFTTWPIQICLHEIVLYRFFYASKTTPRLKSRLSSFNLFFFLCFFNDILLLSVAVVFVCVCVFLLCTGCRNSCVVIRGFLFCSLMWLLRFVECMSLRIVCFFFIFLNVQDIVSEKLHFLSHPSATNFAVFYLFYHQFDWFI